MASHPTNTAGNSPNAGFFDKLAAQPQVVTLGVLGLVAALLAVPIALILVYKSWAASPQSVIVLAAMLKLALVTTLVIHVVAVRQTNELSAADRLRVLVLLVMAEIGFFAAMIGLMLPFTDRLSPYFAAGPEKWGEHRGALALCGGLFFGGLVLMFAGLQLARNFERTRADLRRLLYGYNSILSVLLVISGLGLINVLPYANAAGFRWMGQTVDWTSSRIYTLKPTTVTMLKELNQPVKVYVMMPNEMARKEVMTLLDNFRSYTPHISYETVSRDRDSSRLRELAQKYQLREAIGLLVVYGQGDSEVNEFIKFNDLFSTGGLGREDSSFTFKGEGAMMKTLQWLEDGKSKTRIYFTQGHGEMPITAGGPGAGEESISTLSRQLNLGNYEAKELRFTPDVKKVPEDADIVVIARPERPFSKEAIDALRDYLNRGGEKKGKLIALLEAKVIGDKIPSTGIEDLLKEYNINVHNDRVLQASSEIPNPLIVEAMASESSQTPIAAMFTDMDRGFIQPFQFRRCRSVDGGNSPEGGSRYTVATLMYAVSEKLWVEKDMTVNIDVKAKTIQSDPVEAQKYVVEGRRASIAVTATEPRRGGRPNDPHAFMGGGEQAPKMVVFGTSSWISDRELSTSQRRLNFALFTACVSWLRERPDVSVDEPGLERPMYSPSVKKDDYARLFFMPLFFISVAVVALGGAVWVIRRR
jgi:hypothetical protein